MTTPESTASPAGAERRLHPMSWLFVLLQQLKQFIVPLLALVFLGRGDRNEPIATPVLYNGLVYIMV